MSIFALYHDRARAIVASDGRVTLGDKQTILREDEPKFRAYGSMILGAVGREDVVNQLHMGTRRFTKEANPSFLHLSAKLPDILRGLHANREQVSDLDAKDDRLQVVLCGFDVFRIRSFAFTSDNDFAEVETTQDHGNRIVCFAAVADTDLSEIDALTRKVAKPRGTVFIAAQMRDTINSLSEKNIQVGPARFFAGVDSRGLIELPKEFSMPEAA